MKRIRNGLQRIVAAGLGFTLTTPVLGFDLGRHFEDLQTLPRDGKRFEFHELQHRTVNDRGLNLLRRGQLDFSGAIRTLITGKRLHPRLELKIHGHSKPFYLNGGTDSRTVNFKIGGVEICRLSLRAHQLSDGSMFMLGSIPDIDLYEPIPGTAGPELADTLDVLKRYMDNDDIGLVEAKRCVYNSSGSLLPAWDLRVKDGRLPYRAIADAHAVIDFEKGYFSVDGTARVHAENVNDGNLIDVKLPGLKGNGTLTSTYLKALARQVGTQVTYKQTAISEDHTFNFEPGDSRYDEVSAYAYSQIHFDFFKDIGFIWYGPKPMEVKVHEKPGGQTNNALFVPADSVGEDLPTIFVGDGDGSILDNLPRDADVISHEFGHHVIYQTLKSTKGESLVLHEGLADFFAFARTGDACLGESICPGESSACWIPTQCLRTADNNLSYRDQTYNSVQGHLQGQVISGMLWDMRKSGAIPAEDVTQLTYKSVSFLEDESGFRHFLLALFNADKELFQSKYLDRIKEAAENRGFGELVEDIEPGNTIPLPEDEPNNLAPPPSSGGPKGEEKQESTSDDNFMECAVVPGSGPSGGQMWLLAFLLLVPLVLTQVPVRQPAKAKRRQ